jgi:hypothetical protein
LNDNDSDTTKELLQSIRTNRVLDASNLRPSVLDDKLDGSDAVEAITAEAEIPIQPQRKKTRQEKSAGTAKSTIKPLAANAKYTSEQIGTLLDIVQRSVPYDSQGWDKITSDYNNVFPELNRQKRNLKNKFYELAGKRMPTGDPNMPPEVYKAKKILDSIKTKAAMYCSTNDSDTEVLPNGTADVENELSGSGTGSAEKVKVAEDVRFTMHRQSRRQAYNGNENTEFLKMFLLQDEKNRVEALRREERNEQRQREYMQLQQQQFQQTQMFQQQQMQMMMLLMSQNMGQNQNRFLSNMANTNEGGASSPSRNFIHSPNQAATYQQQGNARGFVASPNQAATYQQQEKAPTLGQQRYAPTNENELFLRQKNIERNLEQHPDEESDDDDGVDEDDDGNGEDNCEDDVEDDDDAEEDEEFAEEVIEESAPTKKQVRTRSSEKKFY